MDQGIIRQPTTEEKKSMKILGEKDQLEEYRQKLIVKQQEFTKLHKPFCYRCAKMDFEDKIEEAKREVERRGKKLMDEAIMKLEPKDLSVYSDPKRFKETGRKEALDLVRGSIIKEQVLIGYHVDYVCKPRGCGHSIFVPLSQTKEVPVPPDLSNTILPINNSGAGSEANPGSKA